MNSNIMDIIMNPVRQRIIQYLIVHGQGSTGEIKNELADIPPASLYRHIRLLLEHGLIEVASEKKVRGTVEKTYRLVKISADDYGNQDAGALIQSGLMSLMAVFNKYFSSGDNDPVKDMLSFSTSTLMLTDAELLDLLKKIGELISGHINNKPEDGRKERRLTIILSPCEEDLKIENKE